MRADPDRATLVEHDDAVRVLHRADPLCDDQARRARKVGFEALSQRRVGAVVEGGERVVEDQDLRLSRERPRDRQPLLLPAGQVCAALRDLAVKSVRKRVDKVLRLRKRQRFVERRFGALTCGAAEREVMQQAYDIIASRISPAVAS